MLAQNAKLSITGTLKKIPQCSVCIKSCYGTYLTKLQTFCRSVAPDQRLAVAPGRFQRQSPGLTETRLFAKITVINKTQNSSHVSGPCRLRFV